MKSKSPASAKGKSKVPVEVNDDDRYDPVPFDPKKHRAKMRRISPEYRAADDALKEEFSALDVRLAARKSNNLTPTQSYQRFIRIVDKSTLQYMKTLKRLADGDSSKDPN